MKSLLGACILIFAFASVSFANLVYVPLKDAVENSDVIIVGTLRNVSEKVEGAATYGEGEILVERYIAGNVEDAALKAGDKLRLKYIEDFACIMGSHKAIENEKGIFLLTVDDKGEIKSKDFRPLENLRELEKLLEKGTKTRNAFKTIKIQNDAEPAFQAAENQDRQTSAVSFGVYSLERKINYRPILTLLVILGSISLYYLLYRSRFKIR